MPRKERKIKEQKKEAIKRAREPPSSPFTPSMASPHEKETKFTYGRKISIKQFKIFFH
jgi:hypothetical protein